MKWVYSKGFIARAKNPVLMIISQNSSNTNMISWVVVIVWGGWEEGGWRWVIGPFAWMKLIARQADLSIVVSRYFLR